MMILSWLVFKDVAYVKIVTKSLNLIGKEIIYLVLKLGVLIALAIGIV